MLSVHRYQEPLEPYHPNLLDSISNNILFKGGIGDVVGAMDKIQSHDDETQGSGSWSGLSDLSNDATDEFGRRLLQHHRDERRMRDATGQQPFSKARPKPRIAETILREERERESQEHQRVGSSGSNDSDPPVTVPKEWGRRARRQRDWMKKIVEPEVDMNGDASLQEATPNGTAIYPHKTAYTGNVNWSIDNPATPSSLRHMNTTIGPAAPPEDDDFTSASLLASTPAPTSTRLPRRIDELTRREIEEIERQALTTRALDEIDQKSPNGTLRRSSSTRLRERAIADAMASNGGSPPSRLPLPTSMRANRMSPSRIPRRQRSPINDKENVPPKRSPMRHNRNDSMNLLRKLARVSSMSPSPAREQPKAEEQSSPTREQPKFEEVPKDEKVDSNHSNGDQATSPPPSADIPGPPKAEEADSDRADREHAAPSPPEDNVPDPPKEKPQSIPHAKSALEAIMQETRDQQNDLQFGESTIQSLEDIVHPNVDPTDPTITFDFDTATAAAAMPAATPDEDKDNGPPLSQAEKDQRQEDLAIEGLNKHLRAARTSIKDASRGLRRVENRIEAAQEGPKSASAPTTTTVAVSKKVDANGITHCECCPGYHGAWYSLWAEFRSLFYLWDPNARFGISFTWLGAWCMAWFIWYLIESTMCEFYCKPEYAVPGHGRNYPPPSDDTPRFPFTIPMVLFSPWQEYWGEGFNALGEAVEAYFHELTHEIPLDSAPPRPATIKVPLTRILPISPEWAAAATATSVRVAQSLMDAVDEVGSMWDDEFLS